MKRGGLLLIGLLAATSAHAKTAPTPLATPPGITLQQVKLGKGAFGPSTTIFADAKGNTAYMSDKDAANASACAGECAAAWPPVLAGSDAKPAGDWTVVKRTDGAHQWAYRGKPLYLSSKDEKAGDVKGNAAGEGWHVATFQPAAGVPMPPGIETLELANAGGMALVDEKTMPLYVFDGDGKKGLPTCTAQPCTDLWKPFEAAQMARDMGEFSVVQRDDGLRQWAFRGLPLYSYAGDLASGDARGDGKGWHVALLVSYFTPQGVEVRNNHFGGSHLADRDGKTLYVRDRVVGTQQGRSYRFGAHVNPTVGRMLGLSTCDSVCTKTWKPLIASKEAQPSGYWDVAVRDDGTRQWAYRGFPVYSFIGDKKPGDMNGIDTYEIMAANDDPFTAADVGLKGAGAMVWHAVAP